MISRRVTRSVRRFAGGLVVLAFLAAVGAPAQADPRASSTPAAPQLQVFDWIQDLLARLGFVVPEPAPEEPRVITGKDGGCLDPNGAPCADNEVLSSPPSSDFGDDA